MALAVDTSTTQATVFDATSATWAHTCTGANLVLYVIIPIFCASGKQATAVTYNGVALTKIADSARSSGGDYVQLWRLINPASGAHNVVITFPATNNNTGTCAAISFTGADQTTPEGTPQTTTGTGTGPSVTVTSATGEIALVGCAWDASGSITGTTGAGQTSILNTTAGGEGSAASYENGAASAVLSYTLSSSTTFAVAGVPIKPATASGSIPLVVIIVTPPSIAYLEV